MSLSNAPYLRGARLTFPLYHTAGLNWQTTKKYDKGDEPVVVKLFCSLCFQLHAVECCSLNGLFDLIAAKLLN